MLTMRNWMFIKQYARLREHLLGKYDLRALGDFDRGVFEDVPDEVVSVAVASIARATPDGESFALSPTPRDDRSRDSERTPRKRAATLCHVGRHTFDPAALKVVPEWPLIYWWDKSFLERYATTPKLGALYESRKGTWTSDNIRFLRFPHEVVASNFHALAVELPSTLPLLNWLPYVGGAKGEQWFDSLSEVIDWWNVGLGIKVLLEQKHSAYPQGTDFFFRRGVAFSQIGNACSARVHRCPSIFGDKGSSVFPKDLAGTVCTMNSTRARQVLASLNPSVSFQVGDVNRLPLFPVANADEIFGQVEAAFTLHESHREASVEFKCPGASPWEHAQDWAQAAVDRPQGAPLPEYVEQLDPESPTNHLSFALGVALGRFSLSGEGILDPATANLSHALPYGILFLDTTLDTNDHRDGLGHPAAALLHSAWAEYSDAIGTKRNLREWLALDFFKDVHKGMYENRPIHWPLSSSSKTFVAWVNIHRLTEQTLRVLLADHLMPTLDRIEGELNDLRTARDGADKKAAREAERQFDRVLKAKDELQAFIANVEQCADRGAPPTDNKCPVREQDARYTPDLDDGVMINSAALWPLLDPQWKDPKKWWKELATATGRKDYDWSHLAMRYWPIRVDEKCRQDPSLGVAHGCFWHYHPGRAWTWELRLQDEIGPDFRIEEAPYRPGGHDLGDAGDRPHRDAWLSDNPLEAMAEKEAIRRMGRGKNRKPVPEMRILESGLWTDHAAHLWEMELRPLSVKQGSELRILAPDEPEARAAFETQHPEKVEARLLFLENLVPLPALFVDEDADDEDDTLDEAEDEEEDES